jgi:hypothetical protein
LEELATRPPPAAIVQNMARKRWDVFISHASEDKERVAVPLAQVLKRSGLEVWLDEFEIHVGDSLRQKLDHGLAESRFGVIVLSHKFFEKTWTQRELGALFAIEEDASSRKVILPVWHNVSRMDVVRYSPLLADRRAATTESGIEAAGALVARAVITAEEQGQGRKLQGSKRPLARRMAEVVDRGDRLALAHLLSIHKKVLESVFDYGAGETIRVVDDGDGIVVSVCGLQLSMAGYRSYNMGLASTAGAGCSVQDLTYQVSPCLDLVRSLIETQKADAPHSHSVICFGRRKDLTDEHRSSLNEIVASLRSEDIEIRSYDWLLENGR